MTQRCHWATQSELEAQYHDEEWGMPVQDDQVLFEFLILEGAQAGLSWRTVLEKRDHYRRHYHQFDPAKVAQFTQEDVERMLADPGLIRNRRKIESSIENARVFLQLQKEHGSFARFAWAFVNNRPLQNALHDYREAPAQTEQSQALSKALKKAGMRFVGPTICYAFMQATGMVNDHETSCCRYADCVAAGQAFVLR